jgi:hypothetical protein
MYKCLNCGRYDNYEEGLAEIVGVVFNPEIVTIKRQDYYVAKEARKCYICRCCGIITTKLHEYESEEETKVKEVTGTNNKKLPMGFHKC